jgi:hypothetical protein
VAGRSADWENVPPDENVVFLVEEEDVLLKLRCQSRGAPDPASPKALLGNS